MHATRKRMGVVLAAFGVAVAMMTTGCAIHTQAPIKEVAYDFSDADFYDRDYAPSPQYRELASIDAAHGPAAPIELAEAAFPVEASVPVDDAAADADDMAAASRGGDVGGSARLLGVRVPAPDAQ